MTSTGPSPEPAGVVAVTWVGDTTVTRLARVPPNNTLAPLSNPLPLIVMGVPPLVEPESGDTEVMVPLTRPRPTLVLSPALTLTSVLVLTSSRSLQP